MRSYLSTTLVGSTLLALACSSASGPPPAQTPEQAPPASSLSPAAVSGPEATAPAPKETTLTQFIVVDQFGYLPNSEKVAVVRDPQKGFDEKEAFSPGKTYAVVKEDTKEKVLTGTATPWNNGATDASSGDKAWWFDFSKLSAPGTYYVLDVERNLRSPHFKIGPDVYKDVLKHAMRMFYYQRAGFAKDAKFAGAAWADAASHVGPLQDKNARLFSAKDDKKTERDLHGGWYDAGDFNKYTNWHASYLISLLRAYEENPKAFADDYGIPESGNGTPDLIDEVKFGYDYLVRLQEKDGGVISIVGLASGSPASAAKGPSLYGPPSTSSSMSSAAAFAYGAKVFKSLGKPEFKKFSEELTGRAKRAWDWAEKNPKVVFKNNDQQYKSQGVGSGQQEVDDNGRDLKKLTASAYLFEITGDKKFQAFFDANYKKTGMIKNHFVYPFGPEEQQLLLYYTKLPGATPGVVEDIRKIYKDGINAVDNFGAIKSNKDPYLSYIKDYTWGSNATQSKAGGMFFDVITFGIDPTLNADAERAALRYVHYLHGVNPLGLVYLSNMSVAGAERSANEFFHTWFSDGSKEWDRVGTSKYGPPPGYLTGGPNPSYNWDGCCPDKCGNDDNNKKCFSEPIVPPKDQPPQKAYKDFNTSWPLDSWSVTEPSNGYQVAYIGLISKFVK